MVTMGNLSKAYANGVQALRSAKLDVPTGSPIRPLDAG